jgi:amino acid transporter
MSKKSAHTKNHSKRYNALLVIAVALLGIATLLTYGNFNMGQTESGQLYAAMLVIIGLLTLLVCTILLRQVIIEPRLERKRVAAGLLPVLILIASVYCVVLIIFNLFISFARESIQPDSWKENLAYEYQDAIKSGAMSNLSPSTQEYASYYSSSELNAVQLRFNAHAPTTKDYMDRTVYHYQLCATFKHSHNYPQILRTADGNFIDEAGFIVGPDGDQVDPDFSSHPSGYYCYKLKSSA